MKSSLFLASVAGAGIASAADCPAPGFTDNQGRYSCNPAHQYPGGQKCLTIDGCLFLADANGKPIISLPSTSTAPAQPTTTPACPAPGFTDNQGRYSCNPAHQYPNGQKCIIIDGCLFLTDANGKPIISRPTSSAPNPTTTPACPAPGFTDNQGRYSCNPAHQYPNGQKCLTIDGCLFLTDANGKPIISLPTSSAPNPATTPSCPAPGSSDSKGRYSCNPAHQYPAGQTCKLIDGCYFLTDASGQVCTNVGPNGCIMAPKTTGGAAQPTGSAACPPPGSTDSQGRYSCNPAHQYPAGQTCTAIQGCYFLCATNGQPIINPTGTMMPPVTAGASSLGGAGVLAFVAALGALF